MAHIVVRIPKEIKEYKEKLILGLNVRQLAASVVALGVVLPSYIFGRKYVNEEALSWLCILVALPIIGFGFLKYNGMTFEQAAAALIRFEFLLPRKRKYKSSNAFAEWIAAFKKSRKTKGYWAKRKSDKIKKETMLEKAYLTIKAESEGNTDFDADKAELVTVRNGKQNNGNNKNNRNGKKKKIEKKKTKLEIQAEAIEKKQAENPEYALSKKEFQIMKRYRAKLYANRVKTVKQGKKDVVKTNEKLKKRRMAKSVLPKTVQDTIPYIADYEEGMFEIEAGRFSKMYIVQDINYRFSKEEEQIDIFCKYREFLNYFTDEYTVSFCVDNRVISKEEQENRVFYKMTGDSFDIHRKEYNGILRRQIIAGKNDIQVEKYVTATITADEPIEALLRFHKIDAEIISNLKKIGSLGRALSTSERLSFYHDKFRKGREGQFKIDFDFLKKQGISSKDYIAPTSFEFYKNDFRIEEGWYRCLFINNLPSNLGDDFFADLVDNDFPVTTSINMIPMAPDKALKLVRRQLTGMEANKIEAEKRAIRSGYSPETIQHNLKQSLEQAQELLDDIINKDQKIFSVSITLMVYGESKDELEDNCKTLKGKANKVACQLQTLTYQQEEAMKLTLPFGYSPKKISVSRTLTSESTTIFMPFSNQELFQPGGFYYGLNQISHNLILCDRTGMKTPSGFVLGSSGSGKSFATKREILNVLLKDNLTNVLIIDPENEYGDFARAFGGTVIKVSADSSNYINPLDMPEDYGLDEDDDNNETPLSVKKDKAIKKKSDFLMSIVERMISVGSTADTSTITPQQKTVVDRCVNKVYKDYLDHDFDINYLPTMLELQDLLDDEGQKSEDGRQMAEGIEYYTRGSMDIFAHKTNVKADNRLIVFNVRDLGDQLRQIALTIVFDFIWNRMIDNKNKNVRTYCYCDEIHVMFESYYSAFFLKQLYKRGRKYGLCITGMTQNVEDLLRSHMARGMIGNSDFIMMLNQSPEDLRYLANMLNISEAQMGFVSRAEAGCGLLFAEKVVVPFVDRFPVESYLYRLMSTKFGEESSKSEIEKQITAIMEQAQSENGESADDANGGSGTPAGVNAANAANTAADTIERRIKDVFTSDVKAIFGRRKSDRGNKAVN